MRDTKEKFKCVQLLFSKYVNTEEETKAEQSERQLVNKQHACLAGRAGRFSNTYKTVTNVATQFRRININSSLLQLYVAG